MINFFKKVVGKDNVRGAYRCLRHFTITRRCVGRIGEMSINNFPCHPELVSGSCHRQKCVTICTVSGKEVLDKVGWAFSPTMKLCWGRNPNLQNVISSTSRTATHHVRGDLVPAFTLAEFFSPYYLSPRQIAFTLAEVFSPYYNSPRKVAFTLAEVLITLGIIGVVAAITLPVLMAKYNKSVVETKLKKFYTTMNQAILLSENKNGDKKYWVQTFSDGNGNTVNDDGVEIAYTKESLESFYNTYLKDFLNVTQTEIATIKSENKPTTSYLLLYFADGSAAAMGYAGSDYLYCTTVEYLKNTYLNPTQSINHNNEGRECFTFGFYPNGASGARNKYFKGKGVEPYLTATWDGTREGLKNNVGNYAKLIQLNGWKIPDDYPIKF